MITYRTAVTPEDREEAIKLVTDVYTAEGYIDPSADRPAGISDYINQPQSTTVMAYVDDWFCGTITIVRDSDQGLPMDVIYHDELAGFREQQVALAEVCQFAVLQKPTDHEKLSHRTNLDVSLGLLSHTIHLALSEQIACLCFTINPKHQLFYRSLGCEQIGEEKSYPFVNNAPALAFSLAVTKLTDSSEQSVGHSFLQKVLTYKPTEEFYAQSAKQQ